MTAQEARARIDQLLADGADVSAAVDDQCSELHQLWIILADAHDLYLEDFGAKADYLLPNQSVNPEPTDNLTPINNAMAFRFRP